MNKSIWLGMAITTTKRQGEKLARSNVRRLRQAKVLMGLSGGLGVLRRFLFSLSHLFEVSLTFLCTSCFLRWDTVPTLFKLLDPSFLLYCSLRPVSYKCFFLSWATSVCIQRHPNTVCKLCFGSISFIKSPKDKHLTLKKGLKVISGHRKSTKSNILPRCLLPDKRQLSRGPGVGVKPCC